MEGPMILLGKSFNRSKKPLKKCNTELYTWYYINEIIFTLNRYIIIMPTAEKMIKIENGKQGCQILTFYSTLISIIFVSIRFIWLICHWKDHKKYTYFTLFLPHIFTLFI